MGIHNESGVKRLSPVPSLHDLVQQLLDLLLTTTDPERSFLNVKGSNDEVVLLVNNLGGLSELELAAVTREAEKSLTGRQVKVQRVLSGTFMVRWLHYHGFVVHADQLNYVTVCTDEPQHARLLPHPSSFTHSIFLWSLRRRHPQTPRRSDRRPRMEMVSTLR